MSVTVNFNIQRVRISYDFHEPSKECHETEKDEEKKDKKFNINIPKIKTPKVIKEIRSRSKSREKKKVILFSI